MSGHGFSKNLSAKMPILACLGPCRPQACVVHATAHKRRPRLYAWASDFAPFRERLCLIPLLSPRMQTELALLPALANRHSCITGATGTGKTVTLVLAGAFSRIGTPVSWLM